MEPFQAFILGVVEGVTEFLPISSTGHLILVSRLLGIEPTEFLKTFEISIQLGAILAVVVLYGRSRLCQGPILGRVLAAFLPTAILGFLLYRLIKKYLLADYILVTWTLCLGGLLLIFFEIWHRERNETIEEIRQMTFKQAIGIGFFQALALIPGVSRAAATIVGGLLLGMKRKTIVEFSFLLAVPTMAAATGLDLYKNWNLLNYHQIFILALGAVTAFVMAILSIKFLLYFVRNHTFISFGIYRILAAALFAYLFGSALK